MKVKDLLIDLNDLWGRFIPGVFTLVGVAFLAYQLGLMTQSEAVIALKDLSEPSFVYMLLGFILAYTLGELSLRPIFKIRKFLPRPSALEVIRQIDVTRDSCIEQFYRGRFQEEDLDKGNRIFSYCKSYLLHKCPSAYNKAKRNEATINLKGGLILPLLFIAILSAFAKLWLVGILATGLTIVFFDGFRTSFSSEYGSVFKAYYFANTVQQNKEISPLKDDDDAGE